MSSGLCYWKTWREYIIWNESSVTKNSPDVTQMAWHLWFHTTHLQTNTWKMPVASIPTFNTSSTYSYSMVQRWGSEMCYWKTLGEDNSTWYESSIMSISHHLIQIKAWKGTHAVLGSSSSVHGISHFKPSYRHSSEAIRDQFLMWNWIWMNLYNVKNMVKQWNLSCCM